MIYPYSENSTQEQKRKKLLIHKIAAGFQNHYAKWNMPDSLPKKKKRILYDYIYSKSLKTQNNLSKFQKIQIKQIHDCLGRGEKRHEEIFRGDKMLSLIVVLLPQRHIYVKIHENLQIKHVIYYYQLSPIRLFKNHCPWIVPHSSVPPCYVWLFYIVLSYVVPKTKIWCSTWFLNVFQAELWVLLQKLSV